MSVGRFQDVVIPEHGTIKRGTVGSILRQAGLTPGRLPEAAGLTTRCGMPLNQPALPAPPGGPEALETSRCWRDDEDKPGNGGEHGNGGERRRMFGASG
jgi:hypothetical protein